MHDNRNRKFRRDNIGTGHLVATKICAGKIVQNKVGSDQKFRAM